MRSKSLFLLPFGLLIACGEPADKATDPSDPADLQASCDDGLLNGDEEDVDCGGSCEPCATEDSDTDAEEEEPIANGCEPGSQALDGSCVPCEAGEYCEGGDEAAVACETYDLDQDPATSCELVDMQLLGQNGGCWLDSAGDIGCWGSIPTGYSGQYNPGPEMFFEPGQYEFTELKGGGLNTAICGRTDEGILRCIGSIVAGYPIFGVDSSYDNAVYAEWGITGRNICAINPEGSATCRVTGVWPEHSEVTSWSNLQVGHKGFCGTDQDGLWRCNLGDSSHSEPHNLPYTFPGATNLHMVTYNSSSSLQTVCTEEAGEWSCTDGILDGILENMGRVADEIHADGTQGLVCLREGLDVACATQFWGPVDVPFTLPGISRVEFHTGPLTICALGDGAGVECLEVKDLHTEDPYPSVYTTVGLNNFERVFSFSSRWFGLTEDGEIKGPNDASQLEALLDGSVETLEANRELRFTVKDSAGDWFFGVATSQELQVVEVIEGLDVLTPEGVGIEADGSGTAISTASYTNTYLSQFTDLQSVALTKSGLGCVVDGVEGLECFQKVVNEPVVEEDYSWFTGTATRVEASGNGLFVYDDEGGVTPYRDYNLWSLPSVLDGQEINQVVDWSSYDGVYCARYNDTEVMCFNTSGEEVAIPEHWEDVVHLSSGHVTYNGTKLLCATFAKGWGECWEYGTQGTGDRRYYLR